VDERKNKLKTYIFRAFGELYFRIWGEKTFHGSAQYFALGRYPERKLITDANLGNDRLSGFSVAKGQILGFSILGFCRRP